MLNFNLCNLLKVTNTILTSVFFIIYTVSASAESLNLKETESLSFTNTLFEYFDENMEKIIEYNLVNRKNINSSLNVLGSSYILFGLKDFNINL